MIIGLRFGASGWLVGRLHDVLAHAGFAVEKSEVAAQQFGASTVAALRAFQQSRGMAISGEVDFVTLGSLFQMKLGPVGALAQQVDGSTGSSDGSGTSGGDTHSPSETTVSSVSGTVASPDRAGVDGLRVQIVDKNIARDAPLAETLTDDRGHYEVRFPAPSIARPRKARLDLQARVHAGETFLAASEIRYNAGANETLDVLLPANASALPSEYETLTRALSAYHDGPLGDLEESDERQDITYLANKTGWDARAIALAALADRLGRDSGEGSEHSSLHPAFYYALLRAGMPVDLDAIHLVGASSAARLWQTAIDQGLIPRALEPKIPAAVNAFRRRGAARALNARSAAAVSTLGETLRLVLGDDTARQQRFADLHAEHGADPSKLWEAVRASFGDELTSRLQLNGQLGYLTRDNAPLMARLYAAEQESPLATTLDLSQRGYHRAEAWSRLLDANTPVPDSIPGETAAARRAGYADLLAAQVRLRFPTAVVAAMVKSGEAPLRAGDEVRRGVHAFLLEHQDRFEIGAQPIEQYLAENLAGHTVSAPVLEQIKRVQRVYQITPGDQAMIGLLKNDLHSAYQVARYHEEEFVERFGEDLGGEAQARLTHARAQQVHGAVLNIAMSYVTARNAPALGASEAAPILAPAPTGPDPVPSVGAAAASGVIAYPTLEGLFGSMDWCACDHCRSVLSPAAYLVDLLFFIDRAPPDVEHKNPLTALDDRRPDIQKLQLTCENTNTPLPYLDLVSEVLEYFVVNAAGATDPPLKGYAGHNDDGSRTAEELLAAPQFTTNQAYEGASAPLRAAVFPPPLPFHRSLETLRRLFDRSELPLQTAMEALRGSDAVERAGAASGASYGWRDILLEQLRLSRDEYRLLTDSTISLGDLFGYPPKTPDDQVIKGRKGVAPEQDLPALSSVKVFTRRIGVSYEELVSILETRFVNPGRDLLPMLERLHISFSTLQAIKGGAPFDPPPGLDPSPYGGGVAAWVRDQSNHDQLMSLITLTNLMDDEKDRCSVDHFELRYAKPDNDKNRLLPIDFIRLARFIRLWKKLGWTIPETDEALTALSASTPAGATDLERLDAGFLVVLQRLGVALQVLDRLGLQPRNDLAGLLACWSLDPAQGLAWLARKLLLSTREIQLLIECTGVDPLVALDLQGPPSSGASPGRTVPVPMMRFLHFVRSLRAAAVKPVQALYLVWNQDLSGKSTPAEAEITALARALRAGLAEVETTFAVDDNPSDELARTRMAQVYGAEATELFFGWLGDALSVEVSYSHAAPALEQSILDAAAQRIRYDDFRKRLSYAGVMSDETRNALQAPGFTEAFKTAVGKLFDAGQAVISPFFTRYPELKKPFNDHVSSSAPPEVKRAALLAWLLPELKDQRKRQQALAAVCAAARTDVTLARIVLGDEAVLHSVRDPAKPALDDLIAVEAAGSIGFEALTAGAWTGYLEAPENGFYKIAVETDKGATITLTLGGEDVVLEQDSADPRLWLNKAPVALTAGKLHEVRLTTKNVGSALTLRWESRGHGWEVVPGRYLYPAAVADRLRSTYVRFLKISALADSLKLTANEVAYLGTTLKVADGGWMNALPVAASADAKTSRALHDVLLDLLDFARIKADLALGDDRLLSLLREPAAKPPGGKSRLSTLTGWDDASIDTLLTHFHGSADRAVLSGLPALRRVHEAHTLVARLGIPASAVVEATTNNPDGASVDALESALRARGSAAEWLGVLGPINDELRSLRRDALVAWVLQKLGARAGTSHIDTADKLFEYFLMDVQMDPCMQTSRVRHALSSIQLFIERCLMNLETEVSPSSIDGKKWEWMKRYRVWEANRKVFLWPENWLEPELRDDASPIFKETMSELLQGDITDDAASTALLNYLSKLEEIAKLEPCGIHYVDSDAGQPNDIAHVVARTAGAHRKYHYRRREHGSWTPWEQIKLDIEDNPVTPVVWRGRLLLFWLRILKKASLEGASKPTQTAKDGALGELKLSDIKADTATGAAQKTRVIVEAVLCWSEHQNGKWQPVKTSDLDRPGLIGEFQSAGPDAFDRSRLALGTALQLDVGEERSPLVLCTSYRGMWSELFILYNTHGLPLLASDGDSSVGWTDPDPTRHPRVDAKRFAIHYGSTDVGFGAGFEQELLKINIEPGTIAPNNLLENEWEAPFFFEDSRNVFYVTPREHQVRVWPPEPRGPRSGLARSSKVVIPPLLIHPVPLEILQGKSRPVAPRPRSGATDPVPIGALAAKGQNIRVAIGNVGNILYGAREIGPSGGLLRSSLRNDVKTEEPR
jgi:peptidoglycan hydrolase-like protein with peptidoglycan-binding domain